MKIPQKTISFSIQLIFTCLCFNLLFIGCTNNDDSISVIKKESANVSDGGAKPNSAGKVAKTVCNISGPNIVTAGSSSSYTYSNSTGTPSSIVWTVLNAYPAGSITISGSGATVTVTFASNFISGTIDVVGSGDGVSICEDKLDIGLAAPVTCAATIYNIWCSQGSAGYNAMINVDVNVTNPFPNTASVLIQWDPNYFSGLQVAGGLYNLSANSSSLFPSQFDITTQTSSPSGFYVPMIVKYTDLVTNAVCIVKLNPLVTGGCNRAPM